jgi:hypothetical protein
MLGYARGNFGDGCLMNLQKTAARLVTLAVVGLAVLLGWFAWEHYT